MRRPAAHIDERSPTRLDERHQDVEARLESLVILAELLDDAGASLGMIFTDRKRMARTKIA
jgi:hypothetical protein